ncbi:DUF2510 domain-containing protein, partial [Cellulomonas sp. APG4]|uniref:DUF2510 domain-containing protein n=1 Tax=Cellulomonas sp. APG4 TaxID=1538656 RepID=UPI00137A2A2E
MSTPGWYTDPADQAGLRWWDGERWTSHVTARPTAPSAPAPGATAAGHAAPVVAEPAATPSTPALVTAPAA